MSSDAATIQPPVQLESICQIALTVRDLAQAKDFYLNKLGMKLLFDAGIMSFFQCGDIRFMIGTAEQQVSIDGTIVYFKVRDIHRTHAHLKEKGVVFIQDPHLIAKMPGHDLWLALMKDPNENVLGIMSEVPRV
jgi:methylmalonyl-CoA/ethylmalonyl-CoA epimerase